jgi:hypothetical protein
MLSKFVKVFPHEYKRVLGIPRYQPSKAEAAHPQQPQVVSAAAGLQHHEAAHG